MEKNNTMKNITSPLRYPGGKSKALREILPFIPLNFSEYREPFLGGGSVFIAVKQLRQNALYKISDLNYDLYCFWEYVKDKPEELVSEIIRIKNNYISGRELYEELACSYDESNDFYRAIRFYILNRITYSGTVDSGGYSSLAFEKRFTLSNIEKLRPMSILLQDVEITNRSYENLLFEEGRNVFIYLDPPYWRSRKSKLYGNHGNLHISFDHRKFAENIKKCKHKWLITYDNSEAIRDMFTFANIYEWEMQYGMNNINGKKAKKGKEIFIANYDVRELPDYRDKIETGSS